MTVCQQQQGGVLYCSVLFCTVTRRPVFQFGRTEVIDNTLNPDFVRKFILDYFFEERQNLRFDL
ncbi:Copine-5 [Liparis tanakae]|uniref:Copine-5 n=1 Tax=Liparis tanakae TaxID=230148 RepID=A0A4Z2E9I3_9TELE|nr:Copine-5 [Liparis tanakae]